MGGVAALARELGHDVAGCDANIYPPMSDQLAALGVHLDSGYRAEHLDAAKPDLVIVGNALSRGNPVVERLLDARIPYISGPQWIGEDVLASRRVFAVAGTHGKTTTTAMLAWILDACGRHPGFLVGGVPENFGVSARLGGGDFVIEADEYDTAFFDKRSKFVHYRPRTAVLNNLEFDHADIFDNLAAIERQFHHLVRTVPASGRIVVNGLEESLARVLHEGCWSEVRSFGAAISDFTAAGEPHSFEVLERGRPMARIEWDLTGTHNQLNALAAIAAAQHVGIEVDAAARALREFRNVKRRMELRGTVNGICVYDDFAHHPTAIRTTLDGLRRRLASKGAASARILAVFEPRSNTMKLGSMKAQLPWSLEPADLAFCHGQGLGWDAQQALAPIADKARVATSIEDLVRIVSAAARPGDHVVCMSNGSFGGIHDRLLRALAAR